MMFVRSVSRQRLRFAGTCGSIFELMCCVDKCGGTRACASVSSVGIGGGGGQCVTSVVVSVPVGVCPLWEWMVVVVVVHLWWQPCSCVL